MSKELSMDALAKLKAQREKLNARIQKMEALEKERERKQDTRRKILIGAYYLDKARQENTMAELNQLMLGFLTRDSDKVLFGCSQPLPSSAENTPKKKEELATEEATV
jgi:hypothetical protein